MRCSLPTTTDSLFAHLAPRAARVAVFRALQLGDMLCAVPALRALRASLPRAHITLVGLPWAADFVARFPHYLDAFIPFPGFPGLPEQAVRLNDIAPFIAHLQAQRFDLALQMHGDGRLTNALVRCFGAAAYAGFYPAHDVAANDASSNRANGNQATEIDAAAGLPPHHMPFPSDGTEVDALLALMYRLGATPTADAARMEFPLPARDRAELAVLMRTQTEMQIGKPRDDAGANPYVCIHPGARGHTRRWHAHAFAAVADALHARELRVVLTGSAAERELVAAVQAHMRAPALNLCGRTTLGTLAALIADARLLVCNDTGVSHLAAATRTPSVVVVTGSDPTRWSPADRTRHRVLAHPIACRPCAYDRCTHRTTLACGAGITPAAVVDAADSLLAETACAA